MIGRVLIIAGSDSGGGAGIQADIKTVTALGGYAMTAITAITVQNTLGVFGVHPIPADIVEAQIRAVLDDIGADVIKIGMLGDRTIVEAVARTLEERAAGIPIVLDPVMIAKGGAALLAEEAIEALRWLLIPRATLVTPNAPEAERLTQFRVGDVNGQQRAARRITHYGAAGALVKGGHIPGDSVTDVLVMQGYPEVPEVFFESPRIETRATHGTGCTLASAIATKLAQGVALPEAVRLAREYLLEAIRRAPGFGAGHGPLDHAWTTRDRG